MRTLDSSGSETFRVNGSSGAVTTDSSITAGGPVSGVGRNGSNIIPFNFDPTPAVTGTGTSGSITSPGSVGVMAIGGGGTMLGSLDVALRSMGYLNFLNHDSKGVYIKPGDGLNSYSMEIGGYNDDGSSCVKIIGNLEVVGSVTSTAGYGFKAKTGNGGTWSLYGLSAADSNELRLLGPSGGTFTIHATNMVMQIGTSTGDKLKIPALIENGIYVKDNVGGGADACAIRAENDNAGGIAVTARVTSTDSCTVFINKGAGDIIRGFSGASGGNQVFTVFNSGRVRCTEVEITGGADIAEPFKVDGEQSVKPGMVVAIDPDHSGQLRLAAQPYDRTVAGIVSGANGVKTGLLMKHEDTAASGSLPVALTGRVYCWCDASADAIRPGDLLTTSATPGHAMKAADTARAQGAILGKAMESLAKGKKGQILVLVTLQ